MIAESIKFEKIFIMKKYMFLLGITGVLVLSSFMPGNNVCESYLPSSVGSKWELTNYDDNDKVTSMSKSELTAVSDIDGGIQTTVNIEILDKKGESTSKGDVTMKCTGDNFYMDMGNMMPAGQMGVMEGVTIEMSNTYMEFPSNPIAGQKLSDYENVMTMKMNGAVLMTTTVKTTNRVIEGFENVTTPAGTFYCMKYTADTAVKAMTHTSTSHSVMYMAKNVGSVKMEMFDDKGKATGKMLLTAFSK